jgi:acetyl-CoA synthase
VIYSLTGMKVETLEDMKKPLEFARKLLPPHVKGKNHLPYLGPLLDAGMAAIFAYEIEEALRILNEPDFYHPEEDPDLEAGKIWLGRPTTPSCVNAAWSSWTVRRPDLPPSWAPLPRPEIAKDDRRRVPAPQPLHLLRGQPQRHHVIEQLIEAGVQIGWNTRIVPFGPDISSAVFALGFANRAAMAFGGVQPGDYKKSCCTTRTVSSPLSTRWAMSAPNGAWRAAGCVNWGFPTLADTDIPEILPTGICTYEHVVANVPHDEMVPEIRRSPRPENHRLRPSTFPAPSVRPTRASVSAAPTCYAQCGGGKTQCTELVKMAEMNEIEDGKVIVDRPGHRTDLKEGDTFPWASTSRWPAVNCRPTSSRSWNARSTT